MNSRTVSAVSMSKRTVFQWAVVGFLFCVGIGSMLTAILKAVA